MSQPDTKPAIAALDVAVRSKPSVYPDPFGARVAGRIKRQLGDFFGLQNFGVNLTELSPGAQSALLHRHSRQDELIYILEGTPTLRMEDGEQLLQPGMCAGFPAGGTAHHLINRTKTTVRYLEIGDRRPGDEGSYPEDDLQAVMEEGKWVFRHKDGSAYD
ncbi:MAG: cupin domain-containing protein [Alphaproteobacteria bacterium]